MENKSAEITFERSSGWIEHFSPDGMRYWTHAERNLQVSEEPDEIKDDGGNIHYFPSICLLYVILNWIWSSENIFNEEENISGEVDTNELNISIGADIVSPIMENVNEIHGEKNSECLNLINV